MSCLLSLNISKAGLSYLRGQGVMPSFRISIRNDDYVSRTVLTYRGVFE